MVQWSNPNIQKEQGHGLLKNYQFSEEHTVVMCSISNKINETTYKEKSQGVNKTIKPKQFKRTVVSYACYLNTWTICFESSLGYRVNSRISRATW